MKIFAVMVFILSMCFSQKYANNVEAWDNSTPHEFTRIKQIDYPWWWSSKISSAKNGPLICVSMIINMLIV